MDTNSFKQKPLFIVVDGGDGSGKDTQVKQIARYYLAKGYKNIRIRSHPTNDNPYGQRAKIALEEGKGSKGYILATVFYTLDVIRSLVKYYRRNVNEVLIFSRYLLGVCYLPSSLIFFGYSFFSRILPSSRYFFFLDVSPEIAKERISERGEKMEMFEKMSRLRKMRKKMQLVTSRKEWFCIDGDGSPRDVWLQIKHILIALDSQTT
ncbi:MAG: thymidylate kinase [Candidatus Hodarchaeota archaeon]